MTEASGGTYRLEFVNCGKPRCTKCAGGPSHGPYWYLYYRRGGKVVSKYIGKTRPAAGGPAPPVGGEMSSRPPTPSR